MKTKSDEVVIKIIDEWCENWDVVIDLFGKELADQLDQAYADYYQRKAFDEKVKKTLYSKTYKP